MSDSNSVQGTGNKTELTEQQGATITVRLIKSFEYKNFRNVILHNVNLFELNLKDLRQLVDQSN
jgi:hypothetical protein